jgi:serine/threonine protein kinase
VIVKKLGWGHFSTVWMARDDNYNNNNNTSASSSQAPSRARYVALKVIHAYNKQSHTKHRY